MSKGMQLLVWWPSRLQSDKDNAAGVIPRLHCEVISPQGKVLSRADALPGEMPRNLPVTLLLHPDDFSLLPVQVPEVRGKKATEALAYATEPLVLADVEDLFITAHAPLQTGQPGHWATVACVERLRARAILNAAVGLGLDVQRVSAEPLLFNLRSRDAWLLDSPAGLWVISSQEPAWLLPHAEWQAGSSRLQQWLHARPGRSGDALLLVSSTPSIRTQWEAVNQVAVDVIGRDALVIVDNPVHLLPEREMRLGSSGRTGTPSPWRLSGQLAALTAALALVLLNVAAQRVRNAERAIDEAVQTAFERAMPNTPMVADPLVMLERAKQQLMQSSQGGSSDFTRLLHAGAMQMQALPFNAVNSIQYDGTVLNLGFGTDVPDAQRRDIDTALRNQQVRSAWQTDDRKRTRVSLSWIKN